MKKTLTTLSAVVMLSAFSPFVYQANAQTPTTIESKLSQTQKALADLNEQIKKVDQAISDNRAMIVQTENKIKDSQNQLTTIEQQVKEIEKRMETRKEILENRARSIQEDGGNIKYLDVLLGSNSISDFISRATAVTAIVQADQDLMTKQKQDAVEIALKRDEIQKGLKDLEDKKTELLGMQEQIEEQQSQNDSTKESLKQKEQSQLAEKAAEEEKARQKAIAAAEAAKAAAAAESSKETSVGNTLATSSEPSVSNNKKPSVSHDSEVPKRNVSIPVSTPKPSGSVNTAISAGYKYIGHSVYVFGGGRSASDIANGRFDCSGFVHWAFAQAGISVGTSTSALSGQGTRVSFSDIQPGDLVFFNTYKHDGHVGIYIGNGNFIGSQSSTGVAIANMTSGYWKQHFSGHVRRIM